MKREVLIQEIDAVLQAVPSDQEIILALRYGDGPSELKRQIAGIRERLEELRAKAAE